MAQQALARIEVIETRMDERQKADSERHEETRKLIIDLRTSFGENFTALQARLSEAMTDGMANLSKSLQTHAAEDDQRFGVISRRSWGAMWSLVATLVTIVLGLVSVIWKMSVPGQ